MCPNGFIFFHHIFFSQVFSEFSCCFVTPGRSQSSGSRKCIALAMNGAIQTRVAIRRERFERAFRGREKSQIW